jgi:carbonic anhydrase
MTRRSISTTLFSFAGLAGMTLLAGCSVPAATEPERADAHWSYDGAAGPDHWGDLSSANEACSSGAEQSPIDLPAVTGTAEEVSFAITSDVGEATSADNGHTVQITPESTASTIEFKGEEYTLLQTHFHAPAEHTVEGQRADAEFHFVHEDTDGNLTVLGILADEGAAEPGWDAYIDAVHDEGDDVTLDIAALLPAELDVYAYEGSLTTPPCTEGVQWLVLTTPIELSAEQIDVLADAHDHTARPVQPLGDRSVLTGTGTLAAD